MDRETIRYLIVALGAAVIILGAGAGIISLLSEYDLAKSIAEAAQIVTPFILIVTLVVLYRQLEHIQEQNSHTQIQNDLQRAVASKSAIQELNEVLLDDKQKDFLRFVFPDMDEKEAREAMMAFSLMNSLELLYLARDKKTDREAFKPLLRGFTKNVRVHWKDPFPTVYHPDFQEIVNEVFDEMEKAEEVAKVLATFEEQDLQTRCFPNLEEAEAGRRRALGSGNYDQALTINLEDYRLPKVFVVWVVGKDEKVAVYFQDGTALPLDVLRRGGEGGEAIPSLIEDEA